MEPKTDEHLRRCRWTTEPARPLITASPWLLGACFLALGACSSGEPSASPVEGAAGAGPGAAGSASWAPQRPSRPDPEPGCTPSDDPDAPDDAFEDSNCDGIDGDVTRGVFVDPQGLDGGDGSFEAPVASLGKGIELALAQEKDVYLCAATYEENVVVEGAGVRIYGGYDCADGWRRKPIQAVVAPAAGRPLTVRSASGPVVLSRVQLLAPAAVEPGESSVAALIVDSGDVLLSHLDLVAGEGAMGVHGEAAKEHPAAPPQPPPGKSAEEMDCFVYGPAPASCSKPCSESLQTCCGYSICPTSCLPTSLHSTCQSVVSGQASGRVRLPSCPSDDGLVPRSFTPGGAGGNGHIGEWPTQGQKLPTEDPKPEEQDAQSKQGKQGPPGAPGAPAAAGFGSIAEDGEYVPSNGGSAGKFGGIAHAGSGGDGGKAYGHTVGGVYVDPRRGGAGGLGGAAGCGGRPGQPGGGGGASIALISVRSNVELHRALLRTASGGAGGHPSAGGAGQPGGPGSAGGTDNLGEKTSTDGLRGGTGGAGGPGGPGGGGPSIGVVAVGPEPVLKATAFDIGPGGPGADPVPGSSVARGADGLSRDVHVLESVTDVVIDVDVDE